MPVSMGNDIPVHSGGSPEPAYATPPPKSKSNNAARKGHHYTMTPEIGQHGFAARQKSSENVLDVESLSSGGEDGYQENNTRNLRRVSTRSKGYTEQEERAVIKKFDRRLVLFIALLYLLSFLDRCAFHSVMPVMPVVAPLTVSSQHRQCSHCRHGTVSEACARTV